MLPLYIPGKPNLRGFPRSFPFIASVAFSLVHHHGRSPISFVRNVGKEVEILTFDGAELIADHLLRHKRCHDYCSYLFTRDPQEVGFQSARYGQDTRALKLTIHSFR